MDKAKITQHFISYAPTDQELEVIGKTGFMATKEQLRFMATSRYVFRTTDCKAFQVRHIQHV
ncbi:MAG: hypothetical protein ACRBFS_21745 [Aureispira sp.]